MGNSRNDSLVFVDNAQAEDIAEHLGLLLDAANVFMQKKDSIPPYVRKQYIQLLRLVLKKATTQLFRDKPMPPQE